MIRQLYTYFGTDTDPYRNLALEQYLTETVADERNCILYLWQNQNTVVIGRNQNAWRECRTGLLESEGGTLARRLSGGGAVYHDLGNLNFTFSVTQSNYDLFRQQRVILEACHLLGIRAERSGRNDILAEGRKFSGNSFYSHNGKAFHNGTLLIRADMEKMGRYLSPSQAKIASKGVDSVRSRVINLQELCSGLTVEKMAEAMFCAFERVYGREATPLQNSDFDAEKLERLRDKFSRRSWVYRAELPFDFACGDKFDWGEVRLEIRVEEGVCSRVLVFTDAMDAEVASALEKALEGCAFSACDLYRGINGAETAPEIKADMCRLISAQNI